MSGTRRAFSILLGALAMCGWLHAQSGETLTNDDVVKMVKAQLAPGIILTTIQTSNAKFDVSPAALIALKNAGVPDEIVAAMQAKVQAPGTGTATAAPIRSGPEKSDSLASSRDPDFILRNFKTMLVDAAGATYFGSQQMTAALGSNREFPALRIAIVDDSVVADTVLKVNYTFAWDYPFTLKHQNTSVVLLSGKGSGPFSGPKGASSVASELVKALKPYRVAQSPTTKR